MSLEWKREHNHRLERSAELLQRAKPLGIGYYTVTIAGQTYLGELTRTWYYPQEGMMGPPVKVLILRARWERGAVEPLTPTECEVLRAQSLLVEATRTHELIRELQTYKLSLTSPVAITK